MVEDSVAPAIPWDVGRQPTPGVQDSVLLWLQVLLVESLRQIMRVIFDQGLHLSMVVPSQALPTVLYPSPGHHAVSGCVGDRGD